MAPQQMMKKTTKMVVLAQGFNTLKHANADGTHTANANGDLTSTCKQAKERVMRDHGPDAATNFFSCLKKHDLCKTDEAMITDELGPVHDDCAPELFKSVSSGRTGASLLSSGDGEVNAAGRSAKTSQFIGEHNSDETYNCKERNKDGKIVKTTASSALQGKKKDCVTGVIDEKCTPGVSTFPMADMSPCMSL